MRIFLYIYPLLFLLGCKLPDIPKINETPLPTQLTLESKFSLVDPMVHVGLQTGAITNDGTVFANENHLIKVWDFENKYLLRILEGHKELVIDMVLSLDESLLYSIGQNENDIIVWDWKTGNIKRKLLGHTSQVNCIRISADGKYLASISMDGTAKIWDTNNGNNINTISGIEKNNPNTKISICNDAKYVAILQSKSFVIFDGENSMEYWKFVDQSNDYGPGEIVDSNIMNYVNNYSDILISSDGNTLFFESESILGSWNINNKNYNKTIYNKSRLITSDPIPGSETPFDISIWKFGYSHNNQKNSTKTLQFTDNERRLIYNYGIFEFKNNDNAYKFKKNGKIFSNSTNSYLLFLKDNFIDATKWNANTSGGQVIGGGFGNYLSTGSNLNHKLIPKGLDISKNSSTMITFDNDKQFITWNLANNYTLNSLNNSNQTFKNLVSSISILNIQNSKHLLFDFASGKLLKEFTVDNNSTPIFNNSEKLFYSNSKIFNSKNGDLKLNLPTIEGGVLFSSDDKQLINLTSNGEIKIFDVITGKLSNTFSIETNNSVLKTKYLRFSLSYENKNLAIATDNEVLIFSLLNGKLVGNFYCKPTFNSSATIKFHPNLNLIAIATSDRKVQIWNSTTRKIIFETVFDFEIINLQFNEDGRKLFVATKKDFYKYNLN